MTNNRNDNEHGPHIISLVEGVPSTLNCAIMYPQMWTHQKGKRVMVTVGVRELKQQASELIRLVRETGSQVQVTYRGHVVALLISVAPLMGKDAEKRSWDDLDTLAAEIGVQWPKGVSAAQVVAEGRR
jgi:prevent-host-death family protein